MELPGATRLLTGSTIGEAPTAAQPRQTGLRCSMSAAGSPPVFSTAAGYLAGRSKSVGRRPRLHDLSAPALSRHHRFLAASLDTLWLNEDAGRRVR